MDRNIWGKSENGQEVYRVTIKSVGGVSAVITNIGATITELWVPCGDGNRDIMLGYGSPEEYFHNGPNLGAPVGRYANRIAGAEFSIGGNTYHLDANNNGNCLHSGGNSWCRQVWDITEESDDSVTFHLFSPDGDQHFPGNLDLWITYSLTSDNALVIDYHAKCDKDTAYAPTQHSYFNLMGHNAGDAMGTFLEIYADRLTYADEFNIPDGRYIDLTGSPLDFRQEHAISERIDADDEQLRFGGGYDHNYVLNKDASLRAPEYDFHGNESYHAGRAVSPDRKVTMDVYTDLPGMQLYTANGLNDSEIGKDGKPYGRRFAFCLETQYYPNAINVPEFPQPVIRAGEDNYTRTVYKFS